jgi:hypothetical protein
LQAEALLATVRSEVAHSAASARHATLTIFKLSHVDDFPHPAPGTKLVTGATCVIRRTKKVTGQPLKVQTKNG